MRLLFNARHYSMLAFLAYESWLQQLIPPTWEGATCGLPFGCPPPRLETPEGVRSPVNADWHVRWRRTGGGRKREDEKVRRSGGLNVERADVYRCRCHYEKASRCATISVCVHKSQHQKLISGIGLFINIQIPEQSTMTKTPSPNIMLHEQCVTPLSSGMNTTASTRFGLFMCVFFCHTRVVIFLCNFLLMICKLDLWGQSVLNRNSLSQQSCDDIIWHLSKPSVMPYKDLCVEKVQCYEADNGIVTKKQRDLRVAISCLE